ncbi:MAG: RDD family protein [Bacteroidales bacterium]
MKRDEIKTSTRFINFLIDMLAISIIAIIVIIILKNYLPAFKEYSVQNNRLITFILYFSYYFIFELLASTTIGKLITKTKVVDIKSLNRPSVIKILVRTLSRFIPLEGLSILLNDKKQIWHDQISGTTIIKKF